jgi:hypothetical protein
MGTAARRSKPAATGNASIRGLTARIAESAALGVRQAKSVRAGSASAHTNAAATTAACQTKPAAKVSASTCRTARNTVAAAPGFSVSNVKPVRMGSASANRDVANAAAPASISRTTPRTVAAAGGRVRRNRSVSPDGAPIPSIVDAGLSGPRSPAEITRSA